jgi:peptidyl-prolyl cis-trans isomerase A (cyclophilin A)
MARIFLLLSSAGKTLLNRTNGGQPEMKRLLSILLLSTALGFAADAKPVHVLLHTEFGDIELELDAAHAPLTTENFLEYVNAGMYNDGEFHRTVTLDNQPQDQIKIQVIQGGMPVGREKDAFPPIKLEPTNKTGLKHKDGTISMARGEPDTATSDFFICIGDQPGLDFGGKRNPDGQGFAAFGHVTRGMDVVRKIQASPAEGQKLTPPLRIVSAVVVR